MPRFGRVVLRTTAPARAAAFYRSLLGHEGDGVVLLPPAAAQRGAVPHWLGHLEVDDPEAVAARWVTEGAARLGAPADETVIVRDPGGAVVALARRGTPSGGKVVWHHLNAHDADTTAASYARHFGWSVGSPHGVPGVGPMRRFSFGADEPAVGTIAGIEGRPGVHPAWLFHFAVDALDASVAHVRASGGLVLGPLTLPSGARVAVCDDPEGAAFGLVATTDVALLRAGGG